MANDQQHITESDRLLPELTRTRLDWDPTGPGGGFGVLFRALGYGGPGVCGYIYLPAWPIEIRIKSKFLNLGPYA